VIYVVNDTELEMIEVIPNEKLPDDVNI